MVFLTAAVMVRFRVGVRTARMQMVKCRDRPRLSGSNPKSPLSSRYRNQGPVIMIKGKEMCACIDHATTEKKLSMKIRICLWP
jgi:hypothetical protein